MMLIMRKTVSTTSLNENCLSLLDEVAARGTELVITRDGEPLAMILPVKKTERDLRGSVTYLVSDEELISPIDSAWSSGPDPES